MAKKTPAPKSVETLTHDEASRRNIPTAEYQSVMANEEKDPIKVAYPRGVKGLEDEKVQRNRDLDPQLVWRGKDSQDWSDLVVTAPPLYIQEKVHPKVLIDDLKRRTDADKKRDTNQPDLFADFNGLPNDDAKTEFYQHDGHWSNRMILGDSLQVMASLAEREGLRGKVQCIYFDPPYGIKFNSNFQWSTTSRDGKDGNPAHITREPEQVKAFRDTWRDGIHSYLTYLRDRLTVARDLLTDSGSIYIQIGDENVHRVRSVLDEVFGSDNFISDITTSKTTSFTSKLLPNINDFVLWYAKDVTRVKYRQAYKDKGAGFDGGWRYKPAASYAALTNYCISPEELIVDSEVTSEGGASTSAGFDFQGKVYNAPPSRHWTVKVEDLERADRAGRIMPSKSRPRYIRRLSDFSVTPMSNVWTDIGGIQSRSDPKVYVVQTATELVKRCLLMATDPGDLVLDPTCGSGTTASVAEQWGRRWITIDTSRVALALARARIMGARYPFYELLDSREGQLKEAQITGTVAPEQAVAGNIRQGFVYERVPHITLKSIANNTEIDVIHEKWEHELTSGVRDLSNQLNALVKRRAREFSNEDLKVMKAIALPMQEWTVPRQAPYQLSEEDAKLVQEVYEYEKVPKPSIVYDDPFDELDNMRYPELPPHIVFAVCLQMYWDKRIARQKEIDASIAAKADSEYLYDKPYVDNKKVRVAGPFTVESLSPHRVLSIDEEDELVTGVAENKLGYGRDRDFGEIILENLKAAGVQQANKQDKIDFTSLTPWPGDLVCAEGRYLEGETEKRAAVFIGPEFGTVSRPDLVDVAKEAAEAGFDVVIACAFSYDAHSSELSKVGRIPVLKARMNADLHMAEDLKNTGKGNLFVIFGEPDIDILDAADGQISVKVNGVDVFHPNTGEVRSDSADGIACWFIDTDYNEESFFVRQAYFLGQNDPYSALKTTLKAEVNQEAWDTLHSDVSRPFDKPKTGRIAVKVINHLGDEVMKVFRV